MLMVAAVAAPASAQVKFEASFLFGYTFAEGVSGDPRLVPGVGTFNSIDIKSGGSVGVSFGVVASNGGEVGFTWSHQSSQLSVSGPSPTLDFGKMSIDSYHGYIGYNFMYDQKMNPYIQIGFGATDYGSVPYTLGQGGTINGPSRFSANISAGVKFFVNDHLGFRAGMVYTPTYLSTTAEGWWCDPYWGCYLTGDNKYSNQFQLRGGVTFRFGGQ
jgi:hypothetical protein